MSIKMYPNGEEVFGANAPASVVIVKGHRSRYYLSG